MSLDSCNSKWQISNPNICRNFLSFWALLGFSKFLPVLLELIQKISRKSPILNSNHVADTNSDMNIQLHWGGESHMKSSLTILIHAGYESDLEPCTKVAWLWFEKVKFLPVVSGCRSPRSVHLSWDNYLLSKSRRWHHFVWESCVKFKMADGVHRKSLTSHRM